MTLFFRLTLACLLAAYASTRPAHVQAAGPPKPPSGGRSIPLSACQAEAASGSFVVVFDATARLVRLPAPKTHAGTPVRLCVENLDLRYVIGTHVTETDLAPTSGATDDLERLARGAGGLSDAPGPAPAADLSQEVEQMTARLKAHAAAATVRALDVREVLKRLTGPDVVPERDGDEMAGRLKEATKAFEALITTLAAADALQKRGGELDATKVLRTVIASAQQTGRPAVWRERALVALNHLAAARHRLFGLSVGAEKKVEVTVTGTRLVWDGVDDAAVTRSQPETLARGSFEVRSLHYVRVSPGLVLSRVASRDVRLVPNEIGARVIDESQDESLMPALFFSHYWCGADVREVQPYDRSRHCWALNLLPSLAVGIPLSRDPLENLFLGGLIQPVPGISLVLGVHYGYVARLRPEFVEGSAPPAPSSGFRIEDAREKRWVSDRFFAITLSDALFVRLLAGLVD